MALVENVQAEEAHTPVARESGEPESVGVSPASTKAPDSPGTEAEGEDDAQRKPKKNRKEKVLFPLT